MQPVDLHLTTVTESVRVISKQDKAVLSVGSAIASLWSSTMWWNDQDMCLNGNIILSLRAARSFLFTEYLVPTCHFTIKERKRSFISKSTHTACCSFGKLSMLLPHFQILIHKTKRGWQKTCRKFYANRRTEKSRIISFVGYHLKLHAVKRC